MTSRVRVASRRLALAATAAALVVGVPLLGGPTVSAQSAGTVTCSGGCGVLGPGLGASSTPDDLPAWGVQVEPPPSGGASSGEPATVDHKSGDLAVDQLSQTQLSQTSASTPDDGPIGLLALIATVCVVGVSVGAVRTLISQRANRAEWA